MEAVADRPARASWIVRTSRNALERAAGRLRHGQLTVQYPDGERRTFGAAGSEPHASLVVRDKRLYARLLRGGEVGFGEAYMDGLFESDDLVELVKLGILNRPYVSLNAFRLGWLSRFRHRRLHAGRANTRAGSKRNIHDHYDLSNDFFRLFLDETVTYSCAIWTAEEQTLTEAQRNKHRLLCQKARVKTGDHVLEIGSGWGEFALTAARTFGCKVTTITISEEQLPVVQQRIKEEGLGHLVEVKLCDYRDVEGTYDAILSTEVFEHIGAEFLESCFRKCESLLRPGGRICIQILGVPDRGYEAARTGMHWMQKYIFPGSVTPSISVLEKSLRRSTLLMEQVEDVAHHYPRTLQEWRRNFRANLPAIRGLGFDERFARMWEFYLATSEACFATRHLSDLQVVMVKPGPLVVGAEPSAPSPTTA